jgi:hypothetical protein
VEGFEQKVVELEIEIGGVPGELLPECLRDLMSMPATTGD